MTHIYDIANKIIDTYCNDFNIDRKQLSKKCGKKLQRVTKDGVNVAFIRQSLAHYLYKRLPLKVTEIGRMIGYSEHSTVSLNSKMVENHIEIQDPYFMPYYIRLTEIADPLTAELNFERVSAYWWRHVDKKSPNILSIHEYLV